VAETPAPTEAPTETQTVVSESDVNAALRNAIVAFALQFNGCPYVHGGRSLSQGTDCSGFTNMIYQNFGYDLDWTPAGQAELGTRIDYHDVQPGDLLFYSNSQKYLGHVALYIGNGQIIHAANEQYGICIWDMNYREPLFAVRIIN
jgi:cell wall-associated NlpC family hydrolase